MRGHGDGSRDVGVNQEEVLSHGIQVASKLQNERNRLSSGNLEVLNPAKTLM